MTHDNKLSVASPEENAAKRMREANLFTKRFGSFTKSDYEILMFTAFLDAAKNPVRDYDISVALGITESKARNLRIKSQLLYPRKLDWVEELAKSIEHGYYNKEEGTVTVTFEDPSVQNLMKNKIEESFGTVGRSLNTKHLIFPIESFLLLAAQAEKDAAATIDALNRALQTESSHRKKIEKKNFMERFMGDIPDLASFLSAVQSVYNIGRPIIVSLMKIL